MMFIFSSDSHPFRDFRASFIFFNVKSKGESMVANLLQDLKVPGSNLDND